VSLGLGGRARSRGPGDEDEWLLYYKLSNSDVNQLFCVFATGGMPYPGMHANEVYQLLLNGKRMDPPIYCPEEM
jgi:hypothetical protein